MSRILVSEGQLVEEGEPLIELGNTQTTAEEFRLTAEGKFTEEKLLRRQIMAGLLWPGAATMEDEEIQHHPSLDGKWEEGRQLLEEYRSIRAQWKTLESQLEERRAEWAASQEIIKQLTAPRPWWSSVLRQFHGLESEKARSRQLTAAITSMEKTDRGPKGPEPVRHLGLVRK